MAGIFSVEELVIDDSFRRYCLRENEADLNYWNTYLAEHPDELTTVMEAKQLVLALSTMLEQEFGRPDKEQMAVVERLEPLIPTPSPLVKISRYAAAVAAIIFFFLIGRFTMQYIGAGEKSADQAARASFSPKAVAYKTSMGEKKLFILPDSTQLWLNAGSELSLDMNFGKSNRKVYLSGEGLFDVTHNKDLPFVVHTQSYDVQVLGTLFNVKAYPGDRQTETALIRGKVEVHLNNSDRKILLSPNQKVVMYGSEPVASSTTAKTDVRKDTSVLLLPLSLSARDNAIIETAWSHNRLEIVDESFTDIKEKLERWYNVQIIFKDEAVAKYRFSATFENETIEQVLQALENAYPFTFEIHGQDVILSK